MRTFISICRVQVKVWFQNRRTKNRRTVDECRPTTQQLEPGRSPSESSDDSFGDCASQDTSCTPTTTTPTTASSGAAAARISPDTARLGGRHVTAMTSRADDDDEDDDDVYIGSHGNRAAAAAGSGWAGLYRLGLSPMSACSAAVTIGQS